MLKASIDGLTKNRKMCNTLIMNCTSFIQAKNCSQFLHCSKTNISKSIKCTDYFVDAGIEKEWDVAQSTGKRKKTNNQQIHI